MAVSVKAILGFDGKAFHAGINRAKGALNTLGGAAKGAMKSQVAQMLSVQFVQSQVTQVAEFAKQVTKLAPALGMTTEELQKWEYVFARAGLEIDDIADAFATLADRTEDALVGTESMIEDFRLIGITVDQLKGKNPVQLFELFADGVQRTTDTNRALTAIVRNLGDDLGRKLAPMLMKGSEGLKEMREEAEKLGIIIESGNLQEMADAMTEMKIASMQMRSAWGDIVKMLSSSLRMLVDTYNFTNIKDYMLHGAAGYASFRQNNNPDDMGYFQYMKGEVKAFFDGMFFRFDKETTKTANVMAAKERLYSEPPSRGQAMLRSSGGINDLIDLKNAREVYNRKVEDHNFKQMSHEEKVTTLLKEREVIQKRMRSSVGKEYFNLAGQSLDLLTQAQALSASRSNSGIRSQGLTASQSVGAFVARSNPLIGIARKQLHTQEQIRDTLQNPKHNPENNPHGTGGMMS